MVFGLSLSSQNLLSGILNASLVLSIGNTPFFNFASSAG
jgi:hypothetical protein